MLIEAIAATTRAPIDDRVPRLELRIDEHRRCLGIQVHSSRVILPRCFSCRLFIARCCVMVFDRKRVFHVVLEIDNERANLSASFFPDRPDIGQCRRMRRSKARRPASAGKATERFVPVEDGNDRHAAGG